MRAASGAWGAAHLPSPADGDNVPGSSPEQLNRIYNTCDIGINTSEAESWGLTAFEHAATGAAQIVPGHTGTREIWDGAAEMLTPTLSLTSPGSLTASELIDPQTVAVTLERLYRDPELLQKRSLDAYQHATQARYNWDTAANSFDQILSELVDQPEGLRDPPILGHQTNGLAAAHRSARH